jgi:hypothetical protein
MCCVLSAPSSIIEEETQENNTQILEEEFQKHSLRLRPYKCKKPQAVVYNASDIIGNYSSSEIIAPYQTVLMRCLPTSGCCKQGNATCKPDKVSNINLVFVAREMVDGIFQKKFIVRNVESHDECKCKN